jgi:hypothetical protein
MSKKPVFTAWMRKQDIFELKSECILHAHENDTGEPMKTKIYLDIDGVLLSRRQEVPKGAIDLIRFIVEHFDCYWLTTHCRSGVNKTISYLSPFYNETTLVLLEQIKPTEWETLKTEAIDFKANFYWLEDYPFESELRVLEKYGKSDRLFKINLDVPGELETILHRLSIEINESGRRTS